MTLGTAVSSGAGFTALWCRTCSSPPLQPGGEPFTRKVVVVDVRKPVTRVSVVLYGSWGSNQAVGVTVFPWHNAFSLEVRTAYGITAQMQGCATVVLLHGS